jgi:hypothetical protein
MPEVHCFKILHLGVRERERERELARVGREGGGGGGAIENDDG